MYKHAKDQKNVKVGDVLEARFTSAYITKGKLYIVESLSSSGNHPIITQDEGSKSTHTVEDFNVLDTLPGSVAKVGDTVMHIDGSCIGVVDDKDVSTQENNVPITWTTQLTSKEWPSDQCCEYPDSIIVLQQAESELSITGCVVDIKGSSLADRLRLRQVLLDNEQVIKKSTKIFIKSCSPAVVCRIDEFNHEWGGFLGKNKKLDVPNISLEDFIQKFKKSDEIRNLAFYKKSGEDWTKGEMNTAIKWAIPTSSGTNFDKIDRKYLYDDDSAIPYHVWYIQDKANFKNCLQVAFEDVFPEAIEPKFEYPIYKINPAGDRVVKFTDMCSGTTVYDTICPDRVNTHTSDFLADNGGYWQDWNPQFDYDTIMQPNTVVHCATESEANELFYWAHQQGLKWAGASGSYLDRNNFDIYKYIAYDIRSGTYGRLEFYEGEEYTILTMDEARNGKPRVEEIVIPTTNLCSEISIDTSAQAMSLEWPIKTKYYCTQPKEQEMKNPFKKGDRVVATKSSRCGNRIKGVVYTVYDVVHGFVHYKDGYSAHFSTFELVSASATTETSEPTTQTKEEIMETNSNTVEVNDKRTQPKTIQQVIEEIFGPQNATDLANKPEFVAHVFNEEEELSEIIAVDTNEAVAAMMQKECRKYFGFAVSVYRLYDTHRLAVPVTSERADATAKKSSKKKARK